MPNLPFINKTLVNLAVVASLSFCVQSFAANNAESNVESTESSNSISNSESEIIESSIIIEHSVTDNSFDLTGELQQGGLMVGKTLPSNKVMLNDKAITVSANGHYTFGFSRDDKASYQLAIISVNGDRVTKTLVPAKREYEIQRIEGIKKSIMQPNPEAVKRSRQDSKQVKTARKIESTLEFFAQGFIPPIEGIITGVYGSQRVYNGVPKSPHFGLDYAGNTGDPVKAPASGKVLLWVPDMFFSGGTMIIDHGQGVSSTFLHLSDSYVKQGDVVKQGQVVAAVGKSGRATGPHLDWRINWFGVRIDPALVLKLKPF